ncbi:MAG TPA: VIT1/CCC1 transporter family protein [Planctomycetota bacterium]|nr:VIT1/CCC1 transporter family protein [Planctomycetota bacterium]
MHQFIKRNLDPAGILGEVLFGLIMALGFTAAVRLGHEDADSRALFTGILGCNIAWAVVDGVMYALTELFERGRVARLARDVLAARDEAEAIRLMAGEMDERVEALTTPEQRTELYRGMLAQLRGKGVEPARLTRDDVMGGIAVALVILFCTLPIVVPYLLVKDDPERAVRISNAIALALLFMLGMWWGRVVGARPVKIGIGLTLVGLVLVGVTIFLGG